MASASKTLQLLNAILLSLYSILSYSTLFYIECVKGEEVFFLNGYVKGTNFTTRNGRNIEAFLGIPYAEPPVGRLRFQTPVELEPWDDILVTDTDRSQCPQLDDNGVVVGDEDCLYLNVYTPQILTPETKHLFPTMVYIHGGNFVRGNGSSTIFGPGYLLDKDIVLVTLNYRLGILGFLSTADAAAPGNFGLKDQVLALKWVQNNIVFFGGDPDKVTVFGQDAGGVSAQLLSLSDSSAGLFSQYISQSGTSICLWAYVDPIDCKDDAKKLGKYLGCPTTNSKALVDCLKKVDINSLVDSDDIFGDKLYRFKTWGPTEEPKLRGAFLTMFPYYKVTIDGTYGHRAIIGHVADEGLVLTAQYYSDNGVYEKVVNNLDTFLQYVVDDFYNHPTPKVTVEQAEEFYFNGTEPGDKANFTKSMTSLITDTFFLQPAEALAQTMLDISNATIYFYSFEYRGTYSETSRVIGSNDNIGVTHGDELTYFFPSTEQFEMSESDEEMIDTMIDLWTSFADTGIPNTKRFPQADFWKLYGDDRIYLKIGNNSDTAMSLHDFFDNEGISFWTRQRFEQTIGSYFKNVIGLH